jgi:5-methylcytosine-specific restriction endonuclease McrA
MPSVTKVNRPWIKKSETQSEKKTDPFYHSPLWRKLRAVVLAEDPLCYYCLLSGLRRLATIGDHFRPRKIYPELSLDKTNIKGSCDNHHNTKRQFEKGISSREQFERLIPELMAKFTGK